MASLGRVVIETALRYVGASGWNTEDCNSSFAQDKHLPSSQSSTSVILEGFMELAV